VVTKNQWEVKRMKTRVSKTLLMICFIVSLLFICGCLEKTVTITTEPKGINLFINGEPGGISPLTKKFKFSKKTETFKVVAKDEKEFYKDGEIIVEGEPVDKTDYHIQLEQIAKMVQIITEPSGATIYIDGKESGISPLTTKLSFKDVKQHEVVAKLQGYEAGKLSIRLEPKDQKNYLVPLEIVPVEIISVVPRPTSEGKMRISFVPVITLAYREVIERSPMVKSVTRVTSNEDPNLNILHPVMSPQGDILVYGELIKTVDGTICNLWKTTVGAFSKTRVTYGKWEDFYPTFTPDGQYLIFSSNRTRANHTLWRIRVDGGGGITNITNTLAEDYSPFVSPDGNIITYASYPPDAVEESQIWSINSNGTLPTQLRDGEVPCISPDGDKILFVRPDKITKKKQIWVMNANGSEETQLTQNSDYDATNPAWSPDGKWIVFDANEGLDSRKIQNSDIWLMSADGSKKTQLTTNGSLDENPCWDHNGKFIYFRSTRGGALNIWRFEPLLP
jgi:WD40 repeat protein